VFYEWEGGKLTCHKGVHTPKVAGPLWCWEPKNESKWRKNFQGRETKEGHRRLETVISKEFTPRNLKGTRGRNVGEANHMINVGKFFSPNGEKGWGKTTIHRAEKMTTKTGRFKHQGILGRREGNTGWPCVLQNVPPEQQFRDRY